MTALANSIEALLRAGNFGLRVAALPDVPPATDKAYRKIRQKLGEGSSETPLEQEESSYWIALARKAFSDENNASHLTLRDIKKIALCLWHSDSPLAADERFLKLFLRTCRQRNRKSIYRTLIWVYLHNYTPSRPGIAFLSKWLTQVVENWDWVWADRQKEYALFDVSKAPRLMAEHIMSRQTNINEALESHGINGTLQSGGMAAAAFAEALKRYKNTVVSLTPEARIQLLRRVLAWASLSGQTFSYRDHAGLFIEHLLLPWDDRAPDDKVMGLTQSFLLEYFGDPRLGGTSWSGVHENAMRVIRRWLVKRALAQFLDVVDGFALDHQWKYRRAFWMAYEKRNVISDAWVVFAPRGSQEAKRIARRNDDNSWLNFGHLLGYTDSAHAVLIMRIGNLTIADFSHNGKWRIWKKDNQMAPAPYEKSYDRGVFLAGRANHEGSHHNSPDFTWQSAVARTIFNETGISMPQRDYTPR